MPHKDRVIGGEQHWPAKYASAECIWNKPLAERRQAALDGVARRQKRADVSQIDYSDIPALRVPAPSKEIGGRASGCRRIRKAPAIRRRLFHAHQQRSSRGDVSKTRIASGKSRLPPHFCVLRNGNVGGWPRRHGAEAAGNGGNSGYRHWIVPGWSKFGRWVQTATWEMRSGPANCREIALARVQEVWLWEVATGQPGSGLSPRRTLQRVLF